MRKNRVTLIKKVWREGSGCELTEGGLTNSKKRV